MSWRDEVEELERRRRWAEAGGGPEAVERQHAQGRLTVRERIERLVDPGSFREVGKLTGTGTYDAQGRAQSVRPAPYVMGLARIDGRPVAVGGEDFTVRGGTSWGSSRRKGGQGGFVEDLAHEFRIPLVNLIDGAGGTVTGIRQRRYATFPGVFGFERSVELLGEVPVLSAVLGSAAGGPAGRAVLSHWSVMVRGKSHIFAAGPPVVARSLGERVDKEALGGARVAVDAAGTIHNAVDSEEAGFAQLRRVLGYLPQNVWELPPVQASADPPGRREDELLTIVPRKRTQPYRMHRLIELVVDAGSAFEIQPSWGTAVITALARLAGHPVGVVANNPLVYGGALDARAARKQVHFLDLCDTFHLPLVFLVDVPGFMVGTRAEEAATLREGMRAVYTVAKLRVPMMTVVIRKCYGMAGMAACNKNGLDFKVAWPSAEWGSLPLEGGVAAAFRRELERAPDPARREREIEAELRAYMSPFRTAEAFAVEDVIDPRETRALLCHFVGLARGRLTTDLGPRPRTGVPP
jgi:acetyl-CoA carboxylase carboxyltransferase component